MRNLRKHLSCWVILAVLLAPMQHVFAMQMSSDSGDQTQQTHHANKQASGDNIPLDGDAGEHTEFCTSCVDCNNCSNVGLLTTRQKHSPPVVPLTYSLDSFTSHILDLHLRPPRRA